MKISIITLFPEMFPSILNASILGRAQSKGKVEFEYINLREFGEGRHQKVDDKSYGGGVGLVLRADILAKALESVSRVKGQGSSQTIILLSPSGKKFDQAQAQKLSKIKHLVLVCGHYEGVDQRFIDKYVDQEISIGDYVLTGGELPAMVVADTIVRLIPGVLAKAEATEKESFSLSTNHSPLITTLEHPHYTKPNNFEGKKVPRILLSGDHQAVDAWRETKAVQKTKKVRPDLIKN